MIFIPGIVITIVTFPGFIMQSVARRFACDILGVPVYEAHYVKGTIVHHRIDSIHRAAFVAYAPFVMNGALCAILMFPVAFSQFLGAEPDGLDAAVQSLLGWAGVSMGMHALPASATVKEVEARIPSEERYKLGYLPIRAAGLVFKITSALKRVWIDLGFALAVGFAVPYVIVTLLTAFA